MGWAFVVDNAFLHWILLNQSGTVCDCGSRSSMGFVKPTIVWLFPGLILLKLRLGLCRSGGKIFGLPWYGRQKVSLTHSHSIFDYLLRPRSFFSRQAEVGGIPGWSSNRKPRRSHMIGFLYVNELVINAWEVLGFLGRSQNVELINWYRLKLQMIIYWLILLLLLSARRLNSIDKMRHQNDSSGRRAIFGKRALSVCHSLISTDITLVLLERCDCRQLVS